MGMDVGEFDVAAGVMLLMLNGVGLGEIKCDGNQFLSSSTWRYTLG